VFPIHLRTQVTHFKPGQRYDVIIEANQSISNYWFRCEMVSTCATETHNNARAVFNYDGVPSWYEPSSLPFLKETDSCEEPADVRPWVPNSVPRGLFLNQAIALGVDFGIGQSAVRANGQNIIYWGVNMSAIDVDWERPTLSYVKQGVVDYPASYNLIEIDRGATVSPLRNLETSSSLHARIPIS
jgi:hypothetical protein